MKYLLLILVLMISVVPFAFAEPVIFSEGIEYEIDETTKEYKLSKYSHITRSQGYTTTGEIFFLRVSDNSDFEYVMLLDKTGHWQKAEIRDKVIESPIEQMSEIDLVKTEKIEIIMTGKYSMVSALKDTIILDFRFYDSKLNPDQNNELNYGTINDADIAIFIVDPTKQNQVEWSIIGKTDASGNFEEEFRVETNKDLMGEYSVDILVQYQDSFFNKSIPLFIEEYNADQVFQDVLRLD